MRSPCHRIFLGLTRPVFIAITTASPHTSLAAVSDGDYSVVFYTSNASRLREQYTKKSTNETRSAEVSSITPRSDIAAVRDKPSDGDADVVRVFFQKDSGDKITEYEYTEAHGWKDLGKIA